MVTCENEESLCSDRQEQGGRKGLSCAGKQEFFHKEPGRGGGPGPGFENQHVCTHAHVFRGPAGISMTIGVRRTTII